MAKLLENSTTTETGQSLSRNANYGTFQAVGSTTEGAGACVVTIQATNDPSNINWLDLGTITLTLGTSETTDGFVSNASWDYVRAKVTSISGTGAKVTVYVGS